MIWQAICLSLGLFVCIVAAHSFFRSTRRLQQRSSNHIGSSCFLVGFFHPYCNAGGGGERVLFAAVSYLLNTEPNIVCAIYSGDNVTLSELLTKVQDRFGISLDISRIRLIKLKRRKWVEASTWPVFTLLGQSLGGAYLASEALWSLEPDVFIDTMGYSFSFPLIKLAYLGLRTGAYIHYPTISTDMLARVDRREAGHTNTNRIAKSFILSTAKSIYYHFFAFCYSKSLLMCDVLMANGSWTRSHIITLISSSPSKDVLKVYPPCDTQTLSKLPLQPRQPMILSLAQFRPEKEHEMQIHAFHGFAQSNPHRTDVSLVIAGSVRNDDDLLRVRKLEELVKDLKLQNRISFVVNAKYSDLIDLFGKASIGLHTMIDEHFGITVVEFMVAGCVALTHASAGPLLDIVTPYRGLPTGMHATNIDEFTDSLTLLFQMSYEDLHSMQQRARESVQEKFSTKAFEIAWEKGYRRIVTA